MNYVKVIPQQHFKLARTLLGLNQENVASIIEITRQNYANIENGKSDPALSTFYKIIDFYIDSGITFKKDEDGSVIVKL